MVVGIGSSWNEDRPSTSYLQILDLQASLRESRLEKTRIQLAYTDLYDRYMFLTSRMTDEELDEVRSREKN